MYKVCFKIYYYQNERKILSIDFNKKQRNVTDVLLFQVWSVEWYGRTNIWCLRISCSCGKICIKFLVPLSCILVVYVTRPNLLIIRDFVITECLTVDPLETKDRLPKSPRLVGYPQ